MKNNYMTNDSDLRLKRESIIERIESLGGKNCVNNNLYSIKSGEFVFLKKGTDHWKKIKNLSLSIAHVNELLEAKDGDPVKYVGYNQNNYFFVMKDLDNNFKDGYTYIPIIFKNNYRKSMKAIKSLKKIDINFYINTLQKLGGENISQDGFISYGSAFINNKFAEKCNQLHAKAIK